MITVVGTGDDRKWEGEAVVAVGKARGAILDGEIQGVGGSAKSCSGPIRDARNTSVLK